MTEYLLYLGNRYTGKRRALFIVLGKIEREVELSSTVNGLEQKKKKKKWIKIAEKKTLEKNPIRIRMRL